MWVILLIYFPIWNPIYNDESQWISLDELMRAIIDFIFSLMQISLLFFTILHQLLEKKMSNSFIFFITLMISTGCACLFYFFVPYSSTIILIFGIGAYILQRLSVMGNIAPFIKKVSTPFHLEKRRARPFLFITIESIVVILAILYIQNNFLSDELYIISPYAYKFWTWTTASFLVVAILILLLIRKHDNPFSQHMKGLFLFFIPILQIYNLYIVFMDISTSLLPEGSTLPFILDLLVFLLLAIWKLLNEIGSEIDLKEEVSPSKLYSLILWSYSITAFVQYNAVLGAEDGFTLADFSEMLSLLLAGFGILYLLNNLGKSITAQHGAQDFSLGKFLRNKVHFSPKEW